MKNKVEIILLYLIILIESSHAYSSRIACNSGDHFACIPSSGEGSCCAKVKVVTKVDGNTEVVGQEFLRCYDFDAILQAFDNNDLLVDYTSNGGNGNTYSLECTDGTAIQRNPEENQLASFIKLNWALLSLLSLISYSTLVL